MRHTYANFFMNQSNNCKFLKKIILKNYNYFLKMNFFFLFFGIHFIFIKKKFICLFKRKKNIKKFLKKKILEKKLF